MKKLADGATSNKQTNKVAREQTNTLTSASARPGVLVAN
jgi:hypothetical protein